MPPAFGGSEMKPYCHMEEMCLGCSPQLIEGICPDSRAGRIVAELVGALKEVFADHAAVNRLSWNDRAAAAIAKIGGAE